ncbi:hypothetical protein O1611_g7055 [Lasiodiplodia mahajangana]|uniref:Uncharacterized protein n=1 Tax=Lasiodiplodia mahajangana TaxID=1108764 RepID=A0ACC2JGK2_9PEZI|nr:hypothetical protein O1611_g7055 [Lasiodiplodia mahajangana]
MASSLRDDVRVQIAPVKAVDLLREAQAAAESGNTISTSLESTDISIKVFHSSFSSVVGETCSFSLLVSADSSRNPFFFKGCAYIPDTDELYATSDLLQSTSSSRLPVILISKLAFRRAPDSGSSTAPVIGIEWMKLRPPPNMPMPSGAIRYKKGVLYCSQGSLEPNSGGLFYMPLGKRPAPLVTNYFGKAFNSIQSVSEDKDGGLWFTDSCAGVEQDIRPLPQLPSHVYWFHPTTGELRVVADGLKRPTGIALSPNGDTLYVTDTEAAMLGNTAVSTSSATIYAYDIVRRPGTSPFLVNKHIFSFAFSGVPAAVTCDSAGNVYAACADGVEVWDSGGTALGLIQIPVDMAEFLWGLWLRFLNPQAGLGAIWNIWFGQAEIIEGLQAWQPISESLEASGIVLAALSWFIFGPILYFVTLPVFVIYLIWALCGAVYAFILGIIHGIFDTIPQVTSDILKIIFVPSFLLESVEAVLMSFGVPRSSLSIQVLDYLLQCIPWVLWVIFGVVTMRLRDQLINREGNANRVFWGLAGILYFYFFYANTLTWSLSWRLTVMSLVSLVVMSSIARVTNTTMGWRYVWLVVAAIVTHLIYDTTISFSWYWQLLTVLVSGFIMYMALQFLGLSDMAAPQLQRQTDPVRLFLFPPDPLVHLWIILTAIILSDINYRVQSLSVEIQVGAVAFAFAGACIALRILQDTAEDSRVKSLVVPVPGPLPPLSEKAPNPYHAPPYIDDDDDGNFFLDGRGAIIESPLLPEPKTPQSSLFARVLENRADAIEAANDPRYGPDNSISYRRAEQQKPDSAVAETPFNRFYVRGVRPSWDDYFWTRLLSSVDDLIPDEDDARLIARDIYYKCTAGEAFRVANSRPLLRRSMISAGSPMDIDGSSFLSRGSPMDVDGSSFLSRGSPMDIDPPKKD